MAFEVAVGVLVLVGEGREVAKLLGGGPVPGEKVFSARGHAHVEAELRVGCGTGDLL